MFALVDKLIKKVVGAYRFGTVKGADEQSEEQPKESEDTEPPTDVTVDEREVTYTFTRKTVEIQFVRGDPVTVTYDVFDGRQKSNTSMFGGKISDGKFVVERGNVKVEKFCDITGGWSKQRHGESCIVPIGEPVGIEVTLANVTARRVQEEIPMKAVGTIKEKVAERTDTGEEEWRVLMEGNVDIEIEEMDGEESE